MNYKIFNKCPSAWLCRSLHETSWNDCFALFKVIFCAIFVESDSSYSTELSNAIRKLFYMELNCSLINLLTFIQMAMKLQLRDAIKTLSCFSLPNLLFWNSKDVKQQKGQKQGQKLGLHANFASGACSTLQNSAFLCLGNFCWLKIIEKEIEDQSKSFIRYFQ